MIVLNVINRSVPQEVFSVTKVLHVGPTWRGTLGNTQHYYIEGLPRYSSVIIDGWVSEEFLSVIMERFIQCYQYYTERFLKQPFELQDREVGRKSSVLLHGGIPLVVLTVHGVTGWRGPQIVLRIFGWRSLSRLSSVLLHGGTAQIFLSNIAWRGF